MNHKFKVCCQTGTKQGRLIAFAFGRFPGENTFDTLARWKRKE